MTLSAVALIAALKSSPAYAAPAALTQSILGLTATSAGAASAAMIGGALMTGKTVVLAVTTLTACVATGFGVSQAVENRAQRDKISLLQGQLTSLRDSRNGEILPNEVALLRRQLTDSRARVALLEGTLSQAERALTEGEGLDSDTTEQGVLDIPKGHLANRIPDPATRVDYFTLIGNGGELDAAEIATLRSIAQQSRDPTLQLALATFLTGEDRILQLKAAVLAAPGNAHARILLALATVQDDSRTADFGEAICEAKALDPTNALPHYLEAAHHLHRGDEEEALHAMAAATRSDYHEKYNGLTAGYREELLRQAGYSPGARRFVAVIGGISGDLTGFHLPQELGRKVMERFQTDMAAGDYGNAREHLEMADTYGRRLQASSRMMVTDLGVLGMRKRALEGKREYHTRMGEVDRIGEIEAALENIERRKEVIKEMVSRMADPSVIFRAAATDEDAARYFEIWLRSGEFAAAQTTME